jgi:hypothetical protein
MVRSSLSSSLAPLSSWWIADGLQVESVEGHQLRIRHHDRGPVGHDDVGVVGDHLDQRGVEGRRALRIERRIRSPHVEPHDGNVADEVEHLADSFGVELLAGGVLKVVAPERDDRGVRT